MNLDMPTLGFLIAMWPVIIGAAVLGARKGRNDA